MMDIITQMIVLLVVALTAIVCGYALNTYVSRKKGREAEEDARRMKEEARKEASNIIADSQIEAKEIIFTAKSQSDAEAEERLANTGWLPEPLRRAIEDDPTIAQAYAYLGEIALSNGNDRQARSYFREGLKRAPANLRLLTRLACVEAVAHIDQR